MQHLGKWAAGIVGGLLALGTLFYAANASSAGTYNSALFLFVILLVFVFAQIKRGFDQAYKDRHYPKDAGSDTGGSGGAQAGGKAAGQTKTASQGAAAQNAAAQNAAGTRAQAGRNGAAKPGGGDGAKNPASSAAASNAAKAGLSEGAPSGPTNGTGAKH